VSTPGSLPGPTWCGHSIARLAELSPRQPIRRAQYRQLFTRWSEQVHAAPAALLPGMFPGIDPSYRQLLEDDLIDASQTAVMTINLFVELWTLLPAVSGPSAEHRREWARAIHEEARGFGAAMSPERPAKNQ
jgi:hypothetical protein